MASPRFKAQQKGFSFHPARTEVNEELQNETPGQEYHPAQPAPVDSSANVLHSMRNAVSRQGSFQTLQRLYGNNYAARVAASFNQVQRPNPVPVVARELDVEDDQAAGQTQVGEGAEDQIVSPEATASPVQRAVAFGSRPSSEIARNRKNKRKRNRNRNRQNQPTDPMGKAIAVAKEKIGYDGFEHEVEDGEIGSWGAEGEGEHGEQSEEEQQAAFLDLASYFDLNKIVIDLGETQGETNVGGVDVSGSAKGKANKEGAEGEGQVEAVFGKSKVGQKGMDWDVRGSKLDAAGKVEGFLGAKAKLKGKSKVNWTNKEFALNGKTSAFIGGSVDVELKTGLEEVGKVQGALGLTIGIGGEYEGQVSWSGGVFKFGGKAKWSAGVGLGFSYKVEIETASLMKKLYSALGWVSGWFGF